VVELLLQPPFPSLLPPCLFLLYKKHMPISESSSTIS
jgi:hypothetical protein